MFVFAIFGKRWHRIKAAFPPATTFTVAMLLATFLHWDRFDINHFPFQVWLVLYIITPLLVPYLWIKNRGTDPGTPEPDDLTVPGKEDVHSIGNSWDWPGTLFVHLPPDCDSYLALDADSINCPRVGRLVRIAGRWRIVCRPGFALERLAYADAEHYLLGHPDPDWGVHKPTGFHERVVKSVYDWNSHRCCGIGRIPGRDGTPT